MSIGCGSLASPSGFRKGIANASSSNGKQHTIPATTEHTRFTQEDTQNFWDAKQTKAPSRLWGTIKSSRFGGEQRVEGTPDHWLSGEFWNVDSNIRKWGEHEIRRNAAAANHDVHRHDQIFRLTLPRQPGDTREARQCRSGVMTADSNFLEAWGFDLGSRDRSANPVPRDGRPQWNPSSRDEHFRAERSFTRDIERMASTYRSIRKCASSPGSTMKHTLPKPEDVGGEAGDFVTDDELGRTHGSRSCRGWDRYDHVAKREGAKLGLGVHAPSKRGNADAHPIKDNLELQPASIYTKKYIAGGEQAMRTFVPRNTRVAMK